MNLFPSFYPIRYPWQRIVDLLPQCPPSRGTILPYVQHFPEISAVSKQLMTQGLYLHQQLTHQHCQQGDFVHPYFASSSTLPALLRLHPFSSRQISSSYFPSTHSNPAAAAADQTLPAFYPEQHPVPMMPYAFPHVYDLPQTCAFASHVPSFEAWHPVQPSLPVPAHDAVPLVRHLHQWVEDALPYSIHVAETCFCRLHQHHPLAFHVS
mmetsp:Transcript_9056/g.14975  ORF Transcript_9056/g.14975 Transcript_9056/m.14975 type:complete len:209 (+) Transcript_9056:122-748(+)